MGNHIIVYIYFSAVLYYSIEFVTWHCTCLYSLLITLVRFLTIVNFRVKQRAWSQDTTLAMSRTWTPSTGGSLQGKEECFSSQLVSSWNHRLSSRQHRQHLVSRRQQKPQSLRLELRDEGGNQLASCRKSVWLCVSMHLPTVATSKCHSVCIIAYHVLIVLYISHNFAVNSWKFDIYLSTSTGH